MPSVSLYVYGKLRTSQGKKHEYLDMNIDYSVPDKFIFSIEKYTHIILGGFPEDIGKTVETLVE